MLLKNSIFFKISIIIFIFIFFLPITVFADDSIYVWSSDTKPLNDTAPTSGNVVNNTTKPTNYA